MQLKVFSKSKKQNCPKLALITVMLFLRNAIYSKSHSSQQLLVGYKDKSAFSNLPEVGNL